MQVIYDYPLRLEAGGCIKGTLVAKNAKVKKIALSPMGNLLKLHWAEANKKKQANNNKAVYSQQSNEVSSSANQTIFFKMHAKI